MTTDAAGVKLTVFLSEDDRIDHRRLHEVLLDRARSSGIAGATVWRGIEGFGASRHVRTSRFPDANHGLPIALELIDKPESIDAFLPTIIELAPHSFISRESVHIHRAG